MLIRDKNKFLDAIKKSDLDTSSFKRHEKDNVDGEPAFIIQLKNSPLFFMTRTDSHDFDNHDVKYIEFSPKFTQSDYNPSLGWQNIQGALEVFDYWLNDHVKTYINELETVDLWEQLEGKVLFGSDPMSSRSSNRFTKPEKERIKSSLANFKKLIELEYSPSSEQLEIVQDRLTYLQESLDRLNKTDWQGIAVSTVISISIALSLDTEKGNKLFSLFKQAFVAAIELIK